MELLGDERIGVGQVLFIIPRPTGRRAGQLVQFGGPVHPEALHPLVMLPAVHADDDAPVFERARNPTDCRECHWGER